MVQRRKYTKMRQGSMNMLEIYKDIPLHRWKVVTLRDGSQTICFNHGGGCIYDVPVWELTTSEGRAFWLRHLRHKIWFPETEEQFWHALQEAK